MNPIQSQDAGRMLAQASRLTLSSIDAKQAHRMPAPVLAREIIIPDEAFKADRGTS